MPGAGNKRRSRWHPLLEESDARDPLQVLLDRVLETPQARGIFGQMQDLIDKAGNAIDPARRPSQPPPRRAAPPPPPPPPAPAHDPLPAARAIMNFGPSEPLTRERITKQRRALAGIFHPDKGGTKEAMQRLNQAADLLLAQHK